MVAKVRSGRRTRNLFFRNSANACGEVTSWVKCRSMKITAGVSADSGTTSWAAQTFSNMVFGVDIFDGFLKRPLGPFATIRFG